MKYVFLKRVALLTSLLFAGILMVGYGISTGEGSDRDKEQALRYYLGSRIGGQLGSGLTSAEERASGGIKGLKEGKEGADTLSKKDIGINYSFTNSLTVKPGVKSLHLNWIPLEGQDVTYSVMWGLQSGNYTDQKDAGNLNSYTITGLDPDKTYYIVVVASKKATVKEDAEAGGIMTIEVAARPLKDTLSHIEKEFQERLKRELTTKIERGLNEEIRREIREKLDEEIRKLEKKTPRDITKEDIKELEEKITKETTEKNKKKMEERIEKELEENVIKQFGYDTFSSIVSSFVPFQGFPAPPDYIIGPGDNFTIYLWGGINEEIPVIVDRTGKINLPFVGSLSVSGLRFSELKDFLLKQFSRYDNLISLNVTMDQLKSIQIFITGDVQFPGSYQVGSLSTLYNSLLASGGPTKKGSLRNIQLIRNGKVISSIDLYEFLLKGKQGKDIKLQPGDTIFVPKIGHVVGITGEVKEPAIYEIKEDMLSLKKLLELAGGLSGTTYLNRVQIERVIPHQEPVAMELDISDPKGEAILTPLKDRDLIKIFPIFMEVKNIVHLEGHVKRPGRYELKPGMRLSDLVPSYDVLLPKPFLGYGEITRLVPPDYHSEVVSFNLGKLLKGDLKEDIEIKNRDRVVLFSEEQMKELPKVYINGEVGYPRDYKLIKNMRVMDLIYVAGNLKREAYLPKAEITRIIKDKDGTRAKQIYISLEEALKDNPDHNILLQEDDTLFVRSIPDWDIKKIAAIKGKVMFPGDYNIQEGDRLSDLIRRAGGYTRDAFIEGAYLIKESARKEQQMRFDEFVKDLELRLNIESSKAAQLATSGETASIQKQSLEVRRMFIEKLKEVKVEGKVTINLKPLKELEGSQDDVMLEVGDTLKIPSRPTIVNVIGRVYNQTSISFRENANVKYYLSKVGGITKDADKESIYIVRYNGTVVSQSEAKKGGLLWKSNENRWVFGGGDFLSAKIMPGDTIIVPATVEAKISPLLYTRDITQILSQTLLSIAALAAIF
ncbi:MAG: SLBB domain-containing protein [Thermodesulfobacteriota bacterium]